MQSLDRAIYKYVCGTRKSGATVAEIGSAMSLMGYPIKPRNSPRVRAALRHYQRMNRIDLIHRRYIKTTHLEAL